MKLHELLVQAREKQNLSQGQLADLLGVSAGTVGGWETDVHAMRTVQVPAVAVALKLKEKVLFDAIVARAKERAEARRDAKAAPPPPTDSAQAVAK